MFILHMLSVLEPRYWRIDLCVVIPAIQYNLSLTYTMDCIMSINFSDKNCVVNINFLITVQSVHACKIKI